MLFDFGGVVTTSPFDGFASYEVEANLPPNTIRRINATDPDTNAWARFERRELSLNKFCTLFEAEAREQGFTVDARRVIAGLDGELRPEMVEAIRRSSVVYRTALLTNNIVPLAEHEAGNPTDWLEMSAVVDLFEVVIESSLVGCRKPELAFYTIACERLGVAPEACVFLDDLGINLKPARDMGMTTIKVGDPVLAIAELEAILGMALS